MDTKLFVQKQSGGMFSIIDKELCTGKIFWVSSGTGTDGAGYGQNPDAPVATLDYAVGLCTASKGDIIYLMPGHAETLIAATSAAVDIAGVRILGLGTGSLQPTFSLGTDAAATIAVTDANVVIKNIKVISALADIAAGITASAAADGLVIEDCWFTDGGTDVLELVIGVSCAAGCDNVLIRNNRFITVTGGGCASGIKFVGATAMSQIVGNYISGDYSVAGIDGATAAGTNLLVLNNMIDNLDGGAGLAISLNSSTTGAMAYNITHGAKDGTSPIAAAGMVVGENYGSNAEGASGLIKPTVDS